MVTKFVYALVVIAVFIGFERCSAQSCVYENNQITCRQMEGSDVQKNMTAFIHEQSVTSLNYKESDIPIVTASMFRKYQFIHSLDLSSSRVNTIEAAVFEDLPILKNLNLRDNHLRKLDSNIFGAPAAVPVEKLDLSCNLLEDLSNFNVTNFSPNLKLNISHNKLEYLPQSFVEKLRGDNQFYIIIDDNPWNCSHPKWADVLDQPLIDAFCTNKTYDPSAMNARESAKSAEVSQKSNLIKAGFEQTVVECSFSRCYYSCVLWFFGGIWIGIILGNVCMLKRLIFRSFVPTGTQVNEYTQYELADTSPKQ